MKKLIVAATLLAVAGLTQAQMPTLKPGLWETKVTKMVNDGKDMTDMLAKLQEQMAKMPPDTRAMVEQRIKASGGGSMRMCISPAMAARYKGGGDLQGHCPPAKVDISGNKVSFSINCTYEGRTTVGTGQSINNGDTITTHADMKSTDASGSHTVVLDSQMHYLGSDCQGLTPLDQK